MNAHTQALLVEMRDSAVAQLEAACQLDAAALDAATERRHAAAVALSAGVRPDPDAIRDQVEEIRQLDIRLTRILKAGERTLSRVLLTPQQTYDRTGRMTTGRA